MDESQEHKIKIDKKTISSESLVTFQTIFILLAIFKSYVTVISSSRSHLCQGKKHMKRKRRNNMRTSHSHAEIKITSRNDIRSSQASYMTVNKKLFVMDGCRNILPTIETIKSICLVSNNQLWETSIF